jgi:P27 family predicted phage terminase small subunit
MSRPPLPIRHHQAVGSYRPDRHQAMPLHPSDLPPPVAPWLTPLAKAKWEEAAAELTAAGVLTALDLDALAVYCEAYATWRAAVDTVAMEGATYKTEGGLVKAHPAVAIMQAADKTLLAWSEKLGLTPSARQRMRIEPPEKKPPGVPSRDRTDKGRFFAPINGTSDLPNLADFMG